MRPSGEKPRVEEYTGISSGKVRLWSLWRVAESSISTLFSAGEPIAMDLLHGDHEVTIVGERDVAAAVFGSHNAGTPCTTLTKGCA